MTNRNSATIFRAGARRRRKSLLRRALERFRRPAWPAAGAAGWTLGFNS